MYEILIWNKIKTYVILSQTTEPLDEVESQDVIRYIIIPYRKTVKINPAAIMRSSSHSLSSRWLWCG